MIGDRNETNIGNYEIHFIGPPQLINPTPVEPPVTIPTPTPVQPPQPNESLLALPLGSAKSFPLVTQDHGCRGKAIIEAGVEDDSCVFDNVHHAGLDLFPIPAAAGDVYASASGTVIDMFTSCFDNDKKCNRGFGNSVIVQHNSNLFTLYAHLKPGSFHITKGAFLEKGQLIAHMGETGNVTGPHLHFEVKTRGRLSDNTGGHFAYTPTRPDNYGYLDPWAFLAETHLDPSPVIITNTQGLFVRRGPDRYTYSAFTEVESSQQFVAFAQYSEGADIWYRIHLPCKRSTCAGWIAGIVDGIRYSELHTSHDQLRIAGTGTEGLNVREMPGGSLLDKVYDGQRFIFTDSAPAGNGCLSNWYRIDLPAVSGSSSGWICGEYILIVTEQDPLPFENPPDPPVDPAFNEDNGSFAFLDSFDVNHQWKKYEINHQEANQFANLVFTSPPSFRGVQPGVVRLRSVQGCCDQDTLISAQPVKLNSNFEARFQEYTYLDQLHSNEKISVLGTRPGIHRSANGELIATGSFELSGNGKWVTIQTPTTQNIPHVFLTAQTANGFQPISLRVRNVTKKSFEAALFEEEAQMHSGHIKEKIAYLLIDSPQYSGFIDFPNQIFPYHLQQLKVGHLWQPVFNLEIKLEEEQSLDNEVVHIKENVDVLKIGQHVFAQQVSHQGGDPTALRIRYNPQFEVNNNSNVIAEGGPYCGSGIGQELLVPEYACYGFGGAVPYAACAVGTLVGYKAVYFGEACKQHDTCYSQNGSTKSTCDDNFHSLLKATCDETLTGALRNVGRKNCHKTASGYYTMVDIFGCNAFKSAQARAGNSNPICN